MTGRDRGLASATGVGHTDRMSPLVMQLFSLGGAALILTAFVMSTSGRMVHCGAPYAALNALGSIAMGISMIQPLNIGGLALQVVWTVYSLWLLVRARSSTR